MRRAFVAGWIGLLPKGFESVDQALAQRFQAADLGLLIRKGVVELGQKLLLVRHLRLNINQSIFVHCRHPKVLY